MFARDSVSADLSWDRWRATFNTDLLSLRDGWDRTLTDWGVDPSKPTTAEPRAAFYIGVAFGDLLQLVSECNGDLRAREGADVGFFVNATSDDIKSAKHELREAQIR